MRFVSLSETLLVLAVVAHLAGAATAQHSPRVLQSSTFRHYIEEFNGNDGGRESAYMDAKAAWAWLERNIPLLECADKALDQIYCFRWWTFRKHIQKTPDGFAIAEFPPDVPSAGPEQEALAFIAERGGFGESNVLEGISS